MVNKINKCGQAHLTENNGSVFKSSSTNCFKQI